MTSTIEDIDIEFEENKNFQIQTIGYISEITRPCPIQYKSMKIQQTQVQQDRTKTLTEFRKDGQVKLKHGEEYNLILVINFCSSSSMCFNNLDFMTLIWWIIDVSLF
jgi:hypothetical protein